MANSNNFPEWLEKMLIEREMTRADLSRKSGISPSQISKILNRQSYPGPDACQAIARALDLPEEEVFRQAGLLSATPEEPTHLGEWIHLFIKASSEDRERMIELARVMSRRSRINPP